MMDTLDDRRRMAAALRDARIGAGFATAAAAARALGVKESTYTHHENGTRGIDPQSALLYGRKFRVDPGIFVGLSKNLRDGGSEVAVMAAAALGVWRDSGLDIELTVNKKSLVVPAAGGESVRYAIEVRDDSIDRVLPAGHFAICVFADENQSPAIGCFVDVEHVRGHLIERTIRHVETDRTGKIKLSTFSTKKQLVSSIPYPAAGRDETVRIIGRVIARYSEMPQIV